MCTASRHDDNDEHDCFSSRPELLNQSPSIQQVLHKGRSRNLPSQVDIIIIYYHIIVEDQHLTDEKMLLHQVTELCCFSGLSYSFIQLYQCKSISSSVSSLLFMRELDML